jgi:hypothetical protein
MWASSVICSGTEVQIGSARETKALECTVESFELP